MTEKELVSKLHELRQIKPSQDWVSLTKKRILGEEQKQIGWLPYFQPFFRLKPSYVGLVIIVIVIGLFGGTQNSLPGDLFYPVKKMVEKSQLLFVSEEQKTEYSLESANKRLEELTKIAETNQVGKLAPALEEYQASIAEVTKNLTRITSTTSDPTVIKKLAEETQRLEENKEKLEKTYGIAGLEIEESSNPTKVLVEWLISDLEKRTLNEEQAKILDEMKELTKQGNYSDSLELYLMKFNGSENRESTQESTQEPATATEEELLNETEQSTTSATNTGY